MKRSVVFSVLVLLAAGLSGCLGGDASVSTSSSGVSEPPGTTLAPSEDDPSVEEEPPAAHVDVEVFEGSLTGASPTVAGPVSLCCGWVRTGTATEGTFTLRETPMAILIELVWSDPVFDLDLSLVAPDYEEELGIDASSGHFYAHYDGNTGSPDGHALILVDDPEVLTLEGDWRWMVGTQAGHNVAFTVYVSIFHGEGPHEDYSAAAQP